MYKSVSGKAGAEFHIGYLSTARQYRTQLLYNLHHLVEHEFI